MSSTEGAQQLSAGQRFAKMGSRVGSNFKPGTFIYSALFGAALGVGVAGADYIFRNIKVRFADKEHLILMSRQRYDPVATRMPFAQLEDKYRF